jgi:myo-inositol-1(or 4)-monophosphatase
VTPERWLEVCRAMRDGVREAVRAVPRARRADELGRGAGGDTTVAVDQVAEDAAFAVLADLAGAAGIGFTVVSEEIGELTLGAGGPWRVVIDPVDGSLNAKRGLPLYAFSVAIADGPAMADVVLGYVYDLGNGEEWIAHRGGGASVDGAALGSSRPLERLQLVALEATRPEHLAPAAAAMPGEVERVRVLGSLALALCHLADGRLDAVASLRPNGARSIDIAAAQLMVREAGAAVALPDAEGPFGAAPLDLIGRSRVVAARDEASVARVAGMLGIGPGDAAGRKPHPG